MNALNGQVIEVAPTERVFAAAAEETSSALPRVVDDHVVRASMARARASRHAVRLAQATGEP